MYLQELFDQLSYGELSQLSIGGGDTGVIDEDNYARIIPQVNLALTAVYKRFLLREEQVDFPLAAGGYTYMLQLEDVLKIEKVFTDTGTELSLNDQSDKYSCHTTSLTGLKVPSSIVDNEMNLPVKYKTASLKVLYRANHPKIILGFKYLNPSKYKLDLPEAFMEPVLLFIAARMLTPLGVGQLEGFAHTTLYSRYEAACEQIEILGLKISVAGQHNRLLEKGWV